MGWTWLLLASSSSVWEQKEQKEQQSGSTVACLAWSHYALALFSEAGLEVEIVGSFDAPEAGFLGPGHEMLLPPLLLLDKAMQLRVG